MDSTTLKMMQNTASMSVRQIDSIATSVRVAQDWFALRSDLLNVAAFSVLGLCILAASFVRSR